MLKNIIEQLSNKPSVMIYDPSSKIRKAFEIDDIFKHTNKSFFYTSVSKLNVGFTENNVKLLTSSEDVTHGTGELSVLSGRCLANGLAKYPYRSRFVLFAVQPFNLFFYLGLIGLLRRFLMGIKDPNAQIKFLGVNAVGKGLNRSYFFGIQNLNSEVTTHFSISDDIGYSGFLNFLEANGGDYVVLRFFGNLPESNRDGGDMDILVSDQLYKKATKFLTSNPGNNMVDLYSVSGPSNAAKMPYHTPWMSRKIIKDKVRYRGFFVPSPKDHLFSFIYHCLYHKGLTSGIPTKYKKLSPSINPDNDYLAEIKKISEAAGVRNECLTLEDLDAFMKEAGWRPHIDTLDLLSSTNRWLAAHLKSEIYKEELGITVCVLKKGFFDIWEIKDFKSDLIIEGFEILNEEKLTGGRELLARDYLRGGNWSSNNDQKYWPSFLFVLLDISDAGFFARNKKIPYNPRPKKEALRKRYDKCYNSHIHMTDNTTQAIEYIDVLYPSRLSDFKNEIYNYDKELQQYRVGGFWNRIRFIKACISPLPRNIWERSKKALRLLI